MSFFCKNIKQALQQLQTEQLHSKAIEAAIDRSTAVIKFTPEGMVTQANQNFCNLMGYRQDELVNQHHRQLCDADFAASHAYSDFWQNLRQGQFFTGRVKRLHNNGNSVWLEVSYNPVLDASGKVIELIKFATDVTEQVEDGARSTAMIEAIERSMAVIEFDLQGNILRVNPNFERTMGYRATDVVGRHHRIFCAADYAASTEYADFWHTLSQGDYLSGRFSRRNKQGAEVWLEATYNPVMGPDGQPAKVVKFATDITRDVQLQRAEQQSAQVAFKVAQETDAHASEGLQVIHSAIGRMQEIRRFVEKSSSEVASLDTVTSQITSAVKSIHDIAEQTNLLALNAAIEAARAGESGRGFAVVADEVRKLADKAGQVTGEISTMISNIKDKSEVVVRCMHEGLSEVERGVDMVDQAGHAIGRMHQGAAQVVQAVQDLSTTVAQKHD